MSRRLFAAICPLFSAALLVTVGFAAQAVAGDAGKKPNIVIVLLDDVGYGDFSCHGNPVVKTPNIDKLHDQCVRLVDFHVCPMCTPTRGELLSGVDCLRNGASLVATSRMQLRAGLPTAADIFAANGYRTGVFGKWHVGETYPYRPQDRGFQESIYFQLASIGQMSDYWGNDYFDPMCWHNGRRQRYSGYCTDVFFDEAMKWMRACAGKGEPFFCYLPTNAAHGPHYVPQKYRDLYSGQKPGVASFFGMIANIDENVGRLDEFLRHAGQFENTIVVFMTDNGGTAAVNLFNAGMRGHKTEYYEGGHRVPCFVRWPGGNLAAPADVAGPAQAQDVLPTLVELCGATDLRGARFDGISLAPALRGQSALPDRTLVVQYGIPKKGKACVLRGRWRLVEGKELYDLSSDPEQAKNVIAEQPEIAGQLRKHYEQWWAGVEPITRQFNAIVIGADAANPQTLAASEWKTGYLASSEVVREGNRLHDAWVIDVAGEGEYEFILRRWPEEADAAIRDGVPAWEPRDRGGDTRGLSAGKALPIAQARFKIGEHDRTQDVGESDRGATFTVGLKPGRTTLEGWFTGADGKEICGAYYVSVRRIGQ